MEVVDGAVDRVDHPHQPGFGVRSALLLAEDRDLRGLRGEVGADALFCCQVDIGPWVPVALVGDVDRVPAGDDPSGALDRLGGDNQQIAAVVRLAHEWGPAAVTSPWVSGRTIRPLLVHGSRGSVASRCSQRSWSE